MTFGETMRAERKASRIPQKELAQMLGQSYQMVAKYEKEYCEPSYKKFLKICEILDMNPFDFMEGENGNE